MIKVEGKCVVPAKKGAGAATIIRTYKDIEGYACRQIRCIQRESDYVNLLEYRDSEDNGRTWSEWKQKEKPNNTEWYGEDEVEISEGYGEVWNPVHGHFVSTKMLRFFPGGHEKSYPDFWERGNIGWIDHQYISIRQRGEEAPSSEQMVCYEEGHPFDPKNPRDPEFLWKNRGYVNAPIVLEDGDIMVPVGVPVERGCQIAGLDVQRVFPSRPNLFLCAMMARGHFNTESGQYDFTFSNPVILSDLQSSRGIDEPQLALLKSGRILLVMRGSNERCKAWETRMEKGTPSFKWYAYSDDGGKTFTEPAPWHFDDGEVIYSSATISAFFRSSRNGKMYWIGNITDHTAYANDPRYPLYIVEVDENTGMAKKESLTVIDTRREGDAESVQLSNFFLLEDRETGHLELSLPKIGQLGTSHYFRCDTWLYDIDLGD